MNTKQDIINAMILTNQEIIMRGLAAISGGIMSDTLEKHADNIAHFVDNELGVDHEHH